MPGWLLSFNLIPRGALINIFGTIPNYIPIIKVEPEDTSEELDIKVNQLPKYWQDIDCSLQNIEKLLPSRKSWSEDARMYGVEDGNGIKIWRTNDKKVESIEITYSLIDIDLIFIKTSLDTITQMDCLLHSNKTGSIIKPKWKSFNREAQTHKACKYEYAKIWKNFIKMNTSDSK